MPRDFKGSNMLLMKPEGLTDEQCMSDVPAVRGIDDQGFPFIATAWWPSKEDIENILNGGPVVVKVYGRSTPPISVFTTEADQP